MKPTAQKGVAAGVLGTLLLVTAGPFGSPTMEHRGLSRGPAAAERPASARRSFASRAAR